LSRGQFGAAPGFADDAPNFGTQPVAARGIQFRKARDAAFGGEEAQPLFAGADRGEEASDFSANRIAQQRHQGLMRAGMVHPARQGRAKAIQRQRD
jgi:hypothetical protein